MSTWHYIAMKPDAMPSRPRHNVRAAGESAPLTSRDNRWLKEFRMALSGGLPTENGFVGVEGVRLVEEALRSGCPIQAVLFSEAGQRHHERDRKSTRLNSSHRT